MVLYIYKLYIMCSLCFIFILQDFGICLNIKCFTNESYYYYYYYYLLLELLCLFKLQKKFLGYFKGVLPGILQVKVIDQSHQECTWPWFSFHTRHNRHVCWIVVGLGIWITSTFVVLSIWSSYSKNMLTRCWCNTIKFSWSKQLFQHKRGVLYPLALQYKQVTN